MKFKLINELQESKLIRTSSYLSRYTLRDILDFTFLYFLVLQIFREEPETKDFAENYMKKTQLFEPRFDHYKRSGTDLYHFLHILIGRFNGDSLDSLKFSDDKNMLLNQFSLKYSDLHQYLQNLKYGRRNKELERRFLLKLESELMILESNYRAIRRLIIDWEDRDFNQRAHIITRLLHAFRHRMYQSELRPMLEKLADKFKYEITENEEKFPHEFWINSKTEKVISAVEKEHMDIVKEKPHMFGISSEDLEMKIAHNKEFKRDLWTDLMNTVADNHWVRGGKAYESNSLYLQGLDQDVWIVANYIKKFIPYEILYFDTFISGFNRLDSTKLKGFELNFWLKNHKFAKSNISRFRESLSEAKMLKDFDFPMWKNPTKSDMNKLLSDYGEIRGNLDSKGNLYIWNAMDASHVSAGKELKYNNPNIELTDAVYFSKTRNLMNSEWQEHMYHYGDLWFSSFKVPDPTVDEFRIYLDRYKVIRNILKSRVKDVSEGLGKTWDRDAFKNIAELVPVDWLKQFRGNNLRTGAGGKVNIGYNPDIDDWEYSDDIKDLAKSMKERGIQEPLILIIGQKDQRACLGEGNHRLVAAEIAGIEELPVRCIIQSKARCQRTVDISHISKIPTEGYVSSDMKPSDALKIPGKD